MVRLELPCDRARVWQLVVGALVEADRVRTDRVVREPRHQRGHDARVHAAAEEHADGTSLRRRSSTERSRSSRQASVSSPAGISVDLGLVAGAQYRSTRGSDRPSQVRMRARAEACGCPRRSSRARARSRSRGTGPAPVGRATRGRGLFGQDRLQLGAIGQTTVRESPVQRLLAEAIARERQPASRRASQSAMANMPRSSSTKPARILLVQVRDRPPCHWWWSAGDRAPRAPIAELDVVVDLPVLGDVDAGVLARSAAGVRLRGR